MTRAQAFALVDKERKRQAELWKREHGWGNGDCSSDDVPVTVKAIVLAEESGEVARAVLERDTAALRKELVQVAAVAIAWLESFKHEGDFEKDPRWDW